MSQRKKQIYGILLVVVVVTIGALYAADTGRMYIEYLQTKNIHLDAGTTSDACLMNFTQRMGAGSIESCMLEQHEEQRYGIYHVYNDATIPYPPSDWVRNGRVWQCAGGTRAGMLCLNNADCPSGGTCSTKLLNPNKYSTPMRFTSTRGVIDRERGGSGEKGIVVITFDDGSESQMVAADLLESYHMDATFCISTGKQGVDSSYCDDVGGGEGDGVLSAVDPGDRPDSRITQAQSVELIARGFDVQSHGHLEAGPALGSYETLITDLDLNFDWMQDNAGRYPATYCVPASQHDFETSVWTSGWFNQVRSSTGGWQADQGLHYNDSGGMRFFGSSIFTGGTPNVEATGQQVCDFIESAVAYNSNAMLVLGFHCISDATEAYNAAPNTYPEDEFELILNCLYRLREFGALEVLNYGDAIAKRKVDEAPWNKFANWGFADLAGSTTNAAHWGIDGNSTIVANSDNMPARRCVDFDSDAASDYAFSQYVGDLEVGATYIAAVDVEWVNDLSGGSPHVNRRTWWDIQPWEGQGDSQNKIEQGRDESDVLGDANNKGYCIGDGTLNHRDVCYAEFVAPTPTVRAGVRGQGGTTGQNWIYCAPRLYKQESIGGKDPNSRTMEWPALITFSVTDTFTSTSGGNKDVDIEVFGSTAPITQRGRGPSHFLITRVDVDVTATDDYSWSIYGRPGGAGDIYCQKTNLIADDDDLTVCAYQDNASNDEYFSTGGDGDAGNEIHFRFTDASATSESVTITIEGYIIR
jgi:peptidoglycan/xylan/chitin deacetylase (PgdA/CDA1 family)